MQSTWVCATRLTCLVSLVLATFASAEERPNVLFCFADDWGRYASIYQDPARPGLCDVIETPALDEIGRRGVVFNHAFVSAPSCTPMSRIGRDRNAVLSLRHECVSPLS